MTDQDVNADMYARQQDGLVPHEPPVAALLADDGTDRVPAAALDQHGDLLAAHPVYTGAPAEVSAAQRVRNIDRVMWFIHQDCPGFRRDPGPDHPLERHRMTATLIVDGIMPPSLWVTAP